MPTYTAKTKQYSTIQGDIWDLIAWKVYGDEHCCAAIQDANYQYRFMDRFGGDVLVDCPETVTIELNVKGPKLPNMKKLQPWR